MNQEETLELYPSGNPKKTIIRGGTVQGRDIIKTYHSKGKLQDITFGYIASDGMEVTVSTSGGDEYSTYYMKDGEKIFHNPDGPAIVSTRKKGGGHNSKGQWMGQIIVDVIYIIHGKRIEDGPAAVSFWVGNESMQVTRETWFEDNCKIKEIDFEYANSRGLIREIVYEKSDDRFPKKLKSTVFEADGTIHYIQHGDPMFNRGDGIMERNPELKELGEGEIELKPEDRNIGYSFSDHFLGSVGRQMLGWKLNKNSKFEFIYDNIF